jgi:hypothetical protein
MSIIFLAVEVVKKQPNTQRLSERIPWLVAFSFGLLHGFGFAGALAEIGLPESDVALALLSFNLGVEIGQLMIVAGALTVLQMMRRYIPYITDRAIQGSAYVIGITAAFWLIERIML